MPHHHESFPGPSYSAALSSAPLRGHSPLGSCRHIRQIPQEDRKLLEEHCFQHLCLFPTAPQTSRFKKRTKQKCSPRCGTNATTGPNYFTGLSRRSNKMQDGKALWKKGLYKQKLLCNHKYASAALGSCPHRSRLCQPRVQGSTEAAHLFKQQLCRLWPWLFVISLSPRPVCDREIK